MEIYSEQVRAKLIKANKCLFVLRSLRKEGFSQGEVDHLFSALVLLNFTYGLPVYGAIDWDLTVIQNFLDRCFKRCWCSFYEEKKLPRYILLHIALAKSLHLASKIITIRVTITFCITVTFCVSYYILWPNRRSKNVLLFLVTIGLWDLMRYGSAQIFIFDDNTRD